MSEVVHAIKDDRTIVNNAIHSLTILDRRLQKIEKRIDKIILNHDKD